MAGLREAVHVDGLPAHEYEWDAMRSAFEPLRRRQSHLICIPGSRTVRYACGYLALFDYAQWAKERDDFLRRASFGLLTGRAAVGPIFVGITVDRDFILSTSAARQRHASGRTFIDITDPELGHIYWSHHLARRYKGRANIPPALPIHYLFPVARVSPPDWAPVPFGSRDYLGSCDSQAPSFYATDDPRAFAAGQLAVDAVIVDADAWDGDLRLLEGAATPLVLVFNDPCDPRLPAAARLVRSRYVFDPAGARELEQNCLRCRVPVRKPGERERICNLTAGTGMVEPVVVNGAPGAALKELGKALARPPRAASGAGTVHATLQHFLSTARLLRFALVNMVVPPRTYDEVVVRHFPMLSTAADLLLALDRLVLALHGEDHCTAGWARDVWSILRELLEEFEKQGTPKQHAVEALLRHQYDLGEGCTILVADRAHARALVEYAARLLDVPEDELGDYGIRVRAVQEDPVDARPEDLLLVTCPAARRAAKFCLAGEAPRICAIGFDWEIVALRQRAARAAEAFSDFGAKPAPGGWLMPLLNLSVPEPDPAIEEVLDPEEVVRPSGRRLPVPSVLSAARDDADGGEAGVLRVWFGTAYVYLREDARVSILDRDAQEIRDVRAADLRPGAIAVLINGAARHSLYSVVLELLREVPELKPHVDNIALWQGEAYRRFRTGAWTSYAELHRRLRDAGSTVRSPQTVRMWILGEVMGPEDPQDIRRLGVLLGSDVLLERWREIGASLEVVRGVHREVALELNRAILRGDTTYRHEFLRLVGVRPMDLREAMEFREVTKVERSESVPAHLVGLVLGVIRDDNIRGERKAV